MADTKSETPLNNKIVPVRGAAQKAAATLKQQSTRRPHTSMTEKASDDQSDAADVADDDEMSFDGSPKRRGSGTRGSRGRGRPRGRGRGRGRGAAGRDDLERARVARKPSNRSLNHRPASSTSSSRSSSPLSSIGPVVTPQKRSRPSTSSTPSKRSKVVSSKLQASSSSTTLITSSNYLELPDGYGDVYTQDDLVWVRLDSQGVLAGPQTERSYWWPAQIISEDVSDVTVKLFGDDGNGEDRLLDISSSTSSTILPFRSEGDVRFSLTSFILAGVPSETTSPFRQSNTGAEKESSSLALSWKAARNQALAVDMDDELPEADALLNEISVKGKTQGKQKEKDEMPKTPTPSRRGKHPVAPLDMEIKVGKEDGELVFARDHKERLDHWPARVIGVSQDKKTNKWLYEVCFIDGKKKKLERSRFFASEEEGFATCQLGEWRTDYPPSDTEGPDSEDEFRARNDRRSASPSPSENGLAEVTDGKEFKDHPLPDQMRYVYPFLCRIIRREYPPSFDRHDAFIKGGKAREQLGQAASLRGHFSENEVNRVSKLVRRTMLRGERWAQRMYDEDEILGEKANPMAQIDRLDGTKAESVAESVFAQSSDMDAAMALAELKSSNETTMHMLHSSSAPSVPLLLGNMDQRGTMINASPLPINDSSSEQPLPIFASNSFATETDAGMPEPPSSEMSMAALGHTSDIELDSEEERPCTPVRVGRTIYNDVEKSSVGLTVPVYQGSTDPECSPSLGREPPGVASISRPRPIGCEEYENLSRSERGLYCADVLLPEAVLQLHLFRDGRRSSAKLLTPEEEKRLYEEGEVLMQTPVHWVTQILMLRKLAQQASKRKSDKRKDKAPPAAMQGVTSTRSRKRRT